MRRNWLFVGAFVFVLVTMVTWDLKGGKHQFVLKDIIAETRDQWRPVSKKFNHAQEHNLYNPNFNISPRDFDIYAGLPEGVERMKRIPLTGWWKLRKLPGSMTEASYDPSSKNLKRGLEMPWKWRGGEELPQKDLGLKEKFYAPDYDDSEWPHAFVPWDWNQGFCDEPMGSRARHDFGGVGWYRREFRLPKYPAGSRVFLYFEYVDGDSTVWVNGVKVGSHSNLERHAGGSRCRGFTLDYHEFDITDVIRPDFENTVAVRVFSDGLWSYKNDHRGRDGFGGIWQPAWVEIRPPVYANKIKIAPSPSDSTVKLECVFSNTLKKELTVDLEALFSPWNSYRYQAPVDGAEIQRLKIPQVKLPPGKSSKIFTLKLDSPILWTHEKPFLYHFRLYAAIKGYDNNRKVLIGQERFGMRDIKVVGDQFHMNGKRLYLPGFQPNEPFRYDVLVANNFEGYVGRWYRSILDANQVYCRYHSGDYPPSFYDLADEVGFLLCVERLIPLPEMSLVESPEFAECVQRMTNRYFNHPAIITYSLGNEHMSSGVRRDRIRKAIPILNKIYDLYKANDTTRPITPCSGSGGIKNLEAKELDIWPKSDYHDNHEYAGGLIDKHFPEIKTRLTKFRDLYRQASAGRDLPYVNGECGGGHYMGHRLGPELAKKFKIDPAKEPRDEYLRILRYFSDVADPNFPEALRVFGKNARARLCTAFFISKVGLRNYLNNPDGEVRRVNEKLLDIYRLRGMRQVGFNLHCSPFSGALKGWKPNTLYEAMREKCVPIYVSLVTQRLHCFAGEDLKLKVRVMNDSMEDEANLRLSAELLSSGSVVAETTKIKIDNLTQDKHHDFDLNMNIPAGLANGHYELNLRLEQVRPGGFFASLNPFYSENSEIIVENQFQLFVYDSAKNTPVAQKREILYFTGNTPLDTEFQQIMKKRGLRFEVADEVLSGLERYQLLVVGPNALGSQLMRSKTKIHNYLRKGGRMVVLCQNTLGSLIPGLKRKSMDKHTLTEPILSDHPLFAGLDALDWEEWNGGVYPVVKGVYPLERGTLACVLPIRRRLIRPAMGAAELKMGEGLILLSQIQAAKNYAQDSVAACYLDNLLSYVAGDAWTGKYACPIEAKENGDDDFPRPDPKKCFAVDLASYCNAGFRDEVDNDGQGGWNDDGSKHDMRVIKLGDQNFAGVPFSIIDPARNQGKSCFVLAGQRKTRFPKRLDGVKVGKRVKRMYFLIAPTYTSAKKGRKIGKIVFHFEKGKMGTTSEVALNLVVGDNVCDWSKLSDSLPSAKVAFESPHPNWDRNVGALVIPWESPYPDEVLESFSIISNGDAVPILIGVTGELVGK